MLSGKFFVDWQLWEEMTFVLLVAIGLVFMAGFIKLFLINRRIKKYTKINAEKKAAMKELRKSGLGESKNDVPFGVRAIQKGVEVDGIWISQPSTPTVETPMGHASKSFGGSIMPPRVRNPTEGGRIPIKGAVEVRTLTPRTSPTYSNLTAQARGPALQHIYKPSRAPPRPARPDAYDGEDASSHADALRSLEGSTSGSISHDAPQTYMPSRSEIPVKNAYPEAIIEYDEYYDQDEPTDPFEDPEPTERETYADQPDQMGGLYTSDAGPSRGKRNNNGGYAPLYSANEADDVDLETGDGSHYGQMR